MTEFKLENHPKIKSGFTAPEGYFDSLPEIITAKINAKDTTRVVPLFKQKTTWFGVAAAILVIALMIPFLQQEPAIKNLGDAEIENYISYQSTISQYDLVNLLESSDIEKIDSKLPVGDQAIEDLLITHDNLENYLID